MIRFFILCFLLFFITSCKEFEGLDVMMKNGELYFSSKKIISICKNGLFITDFGIEYIESSSTKVAWTIVRKSMPEAANKEIDFPLKYGEILSNFSTRSKAINLEPGGYQYGGTVFCQTDNGETGFDLAGKFEITSNGNLQVPVK